MAAAVILNLLLLSISFRRSTSGSTRRHYCKISLMYVNRRLSYCYCAKIQDGGRHFGFIFVQYFGMFVCRTWKVIHVPNFVQICAIINKLWAIN